jgi:hypothetical protein
MTTDPGAVPKHAEPILNSTVSWINAPLIAFSLPAVLHNTSGVDNKIVCIPVRVYRVICMAREFKVLMIDCTFDTAG